MRAALLALALTLAGCASSLGHTAAQGALDAVTSNDARARLVALTAAARDEALGPATDAAVQRIATTARVELDGATDALRAKVRLAVREAIDEALGPLTLREVAELREELLGAALRDDLTAAIDAAAPHLALATRAAVAPVQADVDAEAARWRPIAIGFGAGCVALVLCLMLVVWSHGRTVRMLTSQRG